MSDRADLQTLVCPAERRCPIMPSATHCWHEQRELWEDLFPPSLVCCWCNAETRNMAQAPHRHGPYAQMR